MAVTEAARAAAQELADSFGAAPVIHAYREEAGDLGIDVATFADCPAPGFHSAGTTTLSAHDLGYDEMGLRLEIVGAYPSAAEDFPSMLASCAVSAVRQGWRLRRGAIHPGVMRLYNLSAALEHVFFTRPHLWGEGPRDIETEERTTGWLMAIPITEAERIFAETEGAVALEDLLAEKKANVLDLARPSVV
ncbi:suppressor of fused domain protein [Sphingomonas sp. PR090111-T3T-6A]|uniref:suppressor of fused domain protein n=1 Tax=Sphingomonas sp. PR090111-T3T-6A TaxID=685778 RepID=UPI00036BD6D0|nr:suppressor of fused domain protein [Sphingomonas sp. PR090111-T3T-6A]